MKGFLKKWNLQNADKCVLISGFFLAEFLHCGEKKKTMCKLYKLQTSIFWGTFCKSPHILRDKSQKSLRLDAEFIEVSS